MMTKLTSAILAILISTTAAGARDFAKPPYEVPEDVALPLPTVNRSDVAKALAARRDHNLASFRAYRNAGIYPHNTVRFGPLNVWRDADGHLCAAATMIDRDGKRDLVTKIAETDNNIRLLDVTSGALLDWIMTSGLSIEEIDRIQEPALMPDPSETDPNWRAKFDAKLRTDYAETDAWLVKHRAAGMSAAVDRLMAYPLLAQKLVDGRI